MKAADVTSARSLLVDLFTVGVAAVDPARLVVEALAADTRSAPAAILAVGKAAAGMAWGAAEVYGHRPGLVVSHQPSPVPAGMSHLVTGHPLPDERSVAAGGAALELARALDVDDRLLVLLSGGSSALLESPAPGLTVADLADLTDQLLRSGASIAEINHLRAATSRIKAGGLLEATRAEVTTLAISDVAGDDPHAIGSGPTVVPVGPSRAGEVLQRYRGRVEVTDTLRAAIDSQPAPSGEPRRSDYRVIASAATATQAIAAAAGPRGMNVRVAPKALTGDAAEAALRVLEDSRAAGPGLDICAGETTLEVHGNGIGGRCQHAALVAAAEIQGRSDFVFLAAGTDGRDGPTDAAGAIVDGRSVERAAEAGHTAEAHLAGFDSHRWLVASGDLIVTGPTGTNVGDIWMALTYV